MARLNIIPLEQRILFDAAAAHDGAAIAIAPADHAVHAALIPVALTDHHTHHAHTQTAKDNIIKHDAKTESKDHHDIDSNIGTNKVTDPNFLGKNESHDHFSLFTNHNTTLLTLHSGQIDKSISDFWHSVGIALQKNGRMDLLSGHTGGENNGQEFVNQLQNILDNQKTGQDGLDGGIPHHGTGWLNGPLDVGFQDGHFTHPGKIYVSTHMAYSDSVHGDLVVIANSMMQKVPNTNTIPTEHYYLNEHVSSISTDETHFSNLTLPTGSTVKFAGLFWHENPTVNNNVDPLAKTPTIESVRLLFPDGSLHTVSQDGTNKDIHFQNYVNVTELFSNNSQNGPYAVISDSTPVKQDESVAQDTAPIKPEINGAWSLIVVYENSDASLHDITIFQGAHIPSTHSDNITDTTNMIDTSGWLVTQSSLGSTSTSQISIADSTNTQNGVSASSNTDNSFAGVIAMSLPTEQGDLSVQVPGAQTINEDQQLSFPNNAISVSDGVEEISLSVDHGILTLGSTTGVTIIDGANNSSTITFTGSVTNLNNALNNLTYTPTANFNGQDTLTVKDVTNQPSIIETVDITIVAVNDPPSFNIGPDQFPLKDNGEQIVHNFVTDISAGPQDEHTQNVNFILTNDNNDLFSVQPFIDSAGKLHYTLANGATGTTTVTIIAQDNGGTENGGIDTSAPQQFTITIIVDLGVNAPDSATINEDQQLFFSNNAISIIDDNGPVNATEEVSLSVNNGILTLGSTTGITIIEGANNSSTMTLTGSITDINNALNNLAYTPTADFNGQDTLTVTAFDLDGQKPIPPVVETVNIIINPVNDAPIVTAPTIQTINEDASLVLSTSQNNQISVSDIDANGLMEQVTLSVANGTLTLNSLAGLTFISGDGTGDSTMTFTGTIQNINASLNGLTYIPDANFNGQDALTVTINDLGNTGNGDQLIATKTIDITVNAVNDAPVVNVPSAQTVNEDGSLVLSVTQNNQISVSDVDANGLMEQITLSVANGTLTLNGIAGLTFISGDGTGDSTMTFTGTIENINASLNGLTYTPNANFNNHDTLTVTINDLGNTGNGGPLIATKTIDISVNAVNDAPVVNVPSAQTINEDGSLVLSATQNNQISVSDVDANGLMEQVTLSVTNGTLTLNSLAGLTFISGDGTGDSTMTFTGTIANINASLNGLTYTSDANFNGHDVLSVTINDLGNTGNGGPLIATKTIDITVNAVNDAPVVTVPTTQTINEDSSLILSATQNNQISVSDVDANGLIEQVTLSVTNGTLTLNSLAGLTFISGDGTGDSTMTFTGTIANINASLNGLTYTPDANFNGNDALTVTINDLGNTGNGGQLIATKTIDIAVNAVNDAPVVTAPETQTINEDTSLILSAIQNNQISVSDVDANGLIEQVTLSVTNGTLTLNSLAGLTFISGDGTGDGTMTFTGTIENINASLNGLTYTPDTNFNGHDALTVTINDLNNTGQGSSLIATKTIDISVNAVNDAPVVNGPLPQIINEDSSLVISPTQNNGISINDVDANGSVEQITLSVANGTLTLGSTTGLTFITGDGNADSTMTFTGTIDNLNASLNGLTYTPTANFNGNDSIIVTVNDLGNTGASTTFLNPLIASKTIDVTINSVNDPPSFNIGPNQTVMENSGAQIINNFATNILAGSANEETQALNFIVTNNNNALFAVQPFIDASGNLQFTLANGMTGNAIVTVLLHDSGGTANGGLDISIAQQFTINVTPLPPPPTQISSPPVVQATQAAFLPSFQDSHIIFPTQTTLLNSIEARASAVIESHLESQNLFGTSNHALTGLEIHSQIGMGQIFQISSSAKPINYEEGLQTSEIPTFTPPTITQNERVQLGPQQVVQAAVFTAAIGSNRATRILQAQRTDFLPLAKFKWHGISVIPLTPSVTSRNGDKAIFSVTLNSMPMAKVILRFRSSNQTVGTVSPSHIEFNNADWNIPQEIVVTGTGISEVNQAEDVYYVIMEPAISSDSAYDELTIEKIPINTRSD